MNKDKSNDLIVKNDNDFNTRFRNLDHNNVLGSHNNPNITILEEEQYVDAMSKIIQRDFYPDLPHLKQQVEWMEALESNDTSKLRTIQLEGMKRATTDAKRRNIQATPQSFDTPSQIDKEKQPEDEEEEETKKAKDITDGYSLDEFVANFSSQDDQSYMKLQEKQKQRDRQGLSYKWLSEKKDKQNQYMLTNGQSNQPLSWNYNIKNQLMYIPDSIGSEQEIRSKKEIIYSNTKITTQDDDIVEMENSTKQTPMLELLSTPSIIPGMDGEGVEQSPMMTWGKIDGTPQLLQSTGQTPIPSSLLLHSDNDNSSSEFKSKVPAFKIPKTPTRELLANQLLLKSQKLKSPMPKSKVTTINRGGDTPIFSSPKTSVGSSQNSRSFQSLSPAAKNLLAIRSSPIRNPKTNNNNNNSSNKK